MNNQETLIIFRRNQSESACVQARAANTAALLGRRREKQQKWQKYLQTKSREIDYKNSLKINFFFQLTFTPAFALPAAVKKVHLNICTQKHSKILIIAFAGPLRESD
jgi:hypothetical protein